MDKFSSNSVTNSLNNMFSPDIIEEEIRIWFILITILDSSPIFAGSYRYICGASVGGYSAPKYVQGVRWIINDVLYPSYTISLFDLNDAKANA